MKFGELQIGMRVEVESRSPTAEMWNRCRGTVTGLMNWEVRVALDEFGCEVVLHPSDLKPLGLLDQVAEAAADIEEVVKRYHEDLDRKLDGKDYGTRGATDAPSR